MNNPIDTEAPPETVPTNETPVEGSPTITTPPETAVANEMPPEAAPTIAAPAETPVTTSYSEQLKAVIHNVEKIIYGKREVIYHALLCLLAEGHLLLTDVPGVGKTSLAKALARSLGVDFARVQATSDMLPSDVIGVSVWNQQTQEFSYQRGPIFTNLLLVDEINRASPKSQSALLEAMAEQQVTVDGVQYDLEAPFMVVATQNHLEFEGTYPLPESQLDRFLMQISLGYPAPSEELKVLSAHGAASTGENIAALPSVLSREDILELIKLRKNITVSPELQGYILDLATATRNHGNIALGMSPRATLNLQAVAQARAASYGRGYVLPDDVKAMSHLTVCHRLALTNSALRQGVTPQAVMDSVLTSVPVPPLA